MTDVVNPSKNRRATSFETSAAIALNTSRSFVIRAGNNDIALQNSDLDGTVMNEFTQSSSASSFDVTIDPGETIIFGTYVARDTSTTVTLNSSTNNQTVVVAWDTTQKSNIQIGLSSNISSSQYLKSAIYSFNTDGSGVTSVTDLRDLGVTKHVDNKVKFGPQNLNQPYSISYETDANSNVELHIIDELSDSTLHKWQDTNSGIEQVSEVPSNFNDPVTLGDTGTDPSTAGEITNNNGTIKAQTDGEVREIGIPSGVITMWSGTSTDVPTGWTLCDGNNGAPNLQDQFVVGAGNTYTADATGGQDSVTLSTTQIPSHDHGNGTLAVASHDHGNGTLSVASHDHGPGNLSVASHDHGNGTLAVASHDHGPGNLSVAAHDHGNGNLSVASHDHGNGNLDADHGHGDTFSMDGHGHGDNISVDDHSHGSGDLGTDSHQHTVRYDTESAGGTDRSFVSNITTLGGISSSTTGDDATISGSTGQSGATTSGGVSNNSANLSGGVSFSSVSVGGSTGSSSPNVDSGTTGDASPSLATTGTTGTDSPSVNSGTTNTSSPSVDSGSTDGTGGGGSFDNRPSYYALAYIMKL